MEITTLDKLKLKVVDIESKHRLEIGSDRIPIPYNEENRKFLGLAKAGAGKTQTLFSIIFGSLSGGQRISQGAKDFGETMIVYERKGTDFVPKLFRRKSGKDYLFDPRDAMGIKWNIFLDLLDENGEIDEAMLDFYTSSMIPISSGNSSHFDKQAQGVWKAILLLVCGYEKPSNKALIDFILSHGDLLSLRKSLVKNEIVIKFGMAGVVRNALTTDSQGVADGQGSSVMATLNDIFKKVSRREFYYDDGDFSVREFIKSVDTNKDKRLFIVNTTDMAGSFNLYFALFLNLIFKAGLALPNKSDRRVWLLWDEIQSIGSNGNQALGEYVISEFINFLAESRSKGFCEIVATQSLPQLEKLIGKDGVRSLFQLLSTKIIGQYDEPDGQKFICQYLGEQEIRKTKEGYSEGSKMNDGRVSTNEEEKNKKIVLESELSSLPPLNFFLKIGSYPLTQVAFEYQDPEDITQVLIPKQKPFFDMERVEEIVRLEKEDEDKEKIEMAIEKLKNLNRDINKVEDLSKASRLGIERIKYLLPFMATGIVLTEEKTAENTKIVATTDKTSSVENDQQKQFEADMEAQMEAEQQKLIAEEMAEMNQEPEQADDIDISDVGGVDEYEQEPDLIQEPDFEQDSPYSQQQVVI